MATGSVVVVNQPGVTLYDSTGTEIAPATEATLATRASEATLEAARVLLVALDGKDYATETTLTALGVLLSSLDGKDFATQTTLATRASEATLEAARVLLVSLDGKDFATQTTLEAARVLLASLDGKDYATQTTLATRASEATLEAARVLLASLDGKDYATQTTLATLATEATLEAARVLLVSLDGKDFATETTQVALGVILTAIETKVATETTLASIKDTDGIKKITDGVDLNAGTNEVGKVAQGTKGLGSNGWPVVMYDTAGNPVTITNDAGVYRVEITGKVQTVGAIPPPSTTPTRINADTPLTVGSDDTTFLIPTGEVFYLQSVTAGNEDPTKGAVTEVYFYDGTEHLVERVYTAGFSLQVGYPDLSVARDGTSMLGNGTNYIIVRRAKYSGSNIAIDAEVQGYTV